MGQIQALSRDGNFFIVNWLPLLAAFEWQNEGTGKGLPQSAHAPEAGKKGGNFDALARQKHTADSRARNRGRGSREPRGDRKEQPFPGSGCCCCTLAAAALQLLLLSSCCC